MSELWIRAVVFNQFENRILLYKKDNQHEFLKSRKAVPFKTALKSQAADIIKENFKITGSEIGGVVYLGSNYNSGKVEIFLRVILKKEITLSQNHVWVADRYDIQNLNLDSATREILEKVFNQK